MSTNETLLSPDAQQSVAVDDNIPTTYEQSTPEEEEENNSLSASPEIMISDVQNKEDQSAATAAPESESVDIKSPPILSDPQKEVDNEATTTANEDAEEGNNNNDNNQDLTVADESANDNNNSDVADISCATKDAAAINEEEESEVTIDIDKRQDEIIEERADSQDFMDDTFVSVELASSPTKNSTYEEEVMGGHQSSVRINPSSEVATDAAAPYVPSTTTANVATTTKSSLNITQPITTTTTTTTTRRRKKILHHPILSHLTKLPWDRITNAGSACDVLFNCKYSMRQVEDEVREECCRGTNGEGVYIENDTVEGGREDGYVNVSLNSCSDYNYQEEGCEAGEFEQILGCCSMLDNDEETDEEEEDDEEDVECALPENNVASQKVPHLVQQPMIGLDGSHTNKEVGEEEEREHSVDNNRVDSNNNNELQQQQQSEKSWKQSNPSLDMMLYRQFLNE